ERPLTRKIETHELALPDLREPVAQNAVEAGVLDGRAARCRPVVEEIDVAPGPMRVVLRDLAAVASGQVSDHDGLASGELAAHVRGRLLDGANEAGQAPMLVARGPIAHEAVTADRELDGVRLHAVMRKADGAAESGRERRRCTDTAGNEDRGWNERAVPHAGTRRYFATVASISSSFCWTPTSGAR